jgi:hypothetical protein
MHKLFVDELTTLMDRDLAKLEDEIEAYPSEESLWIVRGDIINPAGNLSLHITGNLQHFIGAILGKTGYVRDRHAEFNDKGVPQDELLEKIRQTRQLLDDVIPTLSPAVLESKYPIEVFGRPMSVTLFLIHLHGHLNYHLGQVNYHRRLLTGK